MSNKFFYTLLLVYFIYELISNMVDYDVSNFYDSGPSHNLSDPIFRFLDGLGGQKAVLGFLIIGIAFFSYKAYVHWFKMKK